MQIPRSTSQIQSLQSTQGINIKKSAEKQLANLRTEQDKSDKKNAPQQRLDIEESAVALVEQQNQLLNTLPLNAGNSSKDPSENNYDRPTQKNQLAVAVYQGVDNLSQRERIQKVFGVDLFV